MRYARHGHRSVVTHANIREYTISQDSTQLQQARQSIWRGNHVLTPTSQSTGLAETSALHSSNLRDNDQEQEAKEGKIYLAIPEHGKLWAITYTG